MENDNLPICNWQRCNENEIPPYDKGVVLIAYYIAEEDEWFYWTYIDCPYGWTTLCNSDAYWMYIGEPIK